VGSRHPGRDRGQADDWENDQSREKGGRQHDVTVSIT
jgi:hypothetical protein